MFHVHFVKSGVNFCDKNKCGSYVYYISRFFVGITVIAIFITIVPLLYTVLALYLTSLRMLYYISYNDFYHPTTDGRYATNKNQSVKRETVFVRRRDIFDPLYEQLINLSLRIFLSSTILDVKQWYRGATSARDDTSYVTIV